MAKRANGQRNVPYRKLLHYSRRVGWNSQTLANGKNDCPYDVNFVIMADRTSWTIATSVLFIVAVLSSMFKMSWCYSEKL